MSTAFVARKPNPIYTFETRHSKVYSGITKQNGDQNVKVKECPVPLTKVPYTQNFKTHYATDPVLTKPNFVGPTPRLEKVQIAKDFNIFTGEENSGPYLNQRVRSSGVGALGVFTEGNLENPSFGDPNFGGIN